MQESSQSIFCKKKQDFYSKGSPKILAIAVIQKTAAKNAAAQHCFFRCTAASKNRTASSPLAQVMPLFCQRFGYM